MAPLIPSMPTLLSLLPSLTPRRLHPALREFLIGCLKMGPLPQHIGFVMDGNRRYSRRLGVALKEGHSQGFEALKRMLDILLHLGVAHVTVYAFAIDNFKRDEEEVEHLMDLARTKLLELCEKGALLDRHGVRIFFIGRRDLLPLDVQAACERMEQLTKSNTRGHLNVAFPYASQEEMATAIRKTVEQTLASSSPPSSITADQIDSNLYTSHSPPLQILIRTSGVHRLSDFLLWQTSGLRGPGAAVHFLDRYWPEVGLLDVVPVVLGWQAEEVVRRVAEATFGWWWWRWSGDEAATSGKQI